MKTPLPHCTRLIAKHFELKLSTTPAPGDDHCAFCGEPIRKGRPYGGPFLPGPGFSDGASLAVDAPRVLCSACMACSRKPVMDRLLSVVVTNDGVFSIFKNTERAWFLLTPPKPPFFAFISESGKPWHGHWRTPPTLSGQYIFLRVGDRILTIDMPLVSAALVACKRIGAAAAAAGATSGVFLHPFKFLDPVFKDPSHAQWRKPYLVAARSGGLSAEIALIDSLGLGEHWALNVLARESLSPVPTPTPVTLRNKSE